VRPVNDFLFGGLHKLTGIGPLVITGYELLTLMMLALAAVRIARGSRVDVVGREPGSNVVATAAGAAFATVVLLSVWGTVRGGDVHRSLIQFRQLLFIPLLTATFAYAFRDLRDFIKAFVVLTAAVCVKVALGVYYFSTDVWPQGLTPEYMTDHHDSVPWVVVLFVWCAAWVHAPRLRRAPLVVALLGWVGLGLALNNRRVAYVSLLASFCLLYVLLQGRLKRRVTRVLLVALPFVAVYLLLARTHQTGVFKPAAALWSVSDQKNTSNVWREAENTNLLFTLRQSWVLGTGWGHEYIEFLKLPDISRFYPQYRLAPHNSVLWLLGVAGVGGFALLWMPLVVGVYLAARSYRFARVPVERTAAAAALSVFAAYAVQAWGDMGLQGVLPAVLMAGALALTGKLARATGAWPAHVRLTSRAPTPTLGAPPVVPGEAS